MTHEVRIYKPVDGKLVHKKTISKKGVIKKFWKDFGINPITKRVHKPKIVKNYLVDHICRTCKKPFQGIKSRLYCYDPCKFVDERVSKPPKIPCALCQQYFQPQRRKVRFCHNPCTYIQWHKLNPGSKVNGTK